MLIFGIVLFAFGIIVSIVWHEYGHFSTARHFGMLVRRFYVGMGPKVFAFRRGETEYGLAASAWTRDVYRAQRAGREIQAGCVWINDHIPIISEMPHGGYKQSGFGKDMSHYSFEEYTQVKHVMSDITGNARKEWHRTIFRGA